MGSSVSSPSLKLVQALNDQDSEFISETLKSEDVKTWINDSVALKGIKRSRVKFSNDFKYATCLTYASQSIWHDASTVRQLVEAGADVKVTDAFGNTPLHRACRSDKDAIVKVEFLLQCDAFLVSAKNKQQDTPLTVAAQAGNDDVISVLIKYGAKVNEPGQVGRLALHLACMSGHAGCIPVLLKHGADIEAGDKTDRKDTALILAACVNQINCVKTLIQSGALINNGNHYNHTPLLCACQAGNLEIVKLLTSQPTCDLDAKLFGKPAAYWAEEAGHKNIARYLENLSADRNLAEASVTSAMVLSNITYDSKGYKILQDQTLRRIARKAGHTRVDLGTELELEWADIKTLESRHSDPVDHAFHILMTWRERTGNMSEKEQIDELGKVMTEIGRKDLLHYIGL